MDIIICIANCFLFNLETDHVLLSQGMISTGAWSLVAIIERSHYFPIRIFDTMGEDGCIKNGKESLHTHAHFIRFNALTGQRWLELEWIEIQ